MIDLGLNARRIVAGLYLVLGVSICAVAVLAPGRQGFAAFGAIKQVTLPLSYLIFAVIAAKGLGASKHRVRPPAWLWTLLPLTAFSLFGARFGVHYESTLEDLAQGLALICGFVLFGFVGITAPHWEPREQRRLLAFVICSGVVAVLMGGVGIGPLIALGIPGFFMTVVLVAVTPKWRISLAALAAMSGILLWRALPPAPGAPISLGVLSEVGVCAGVVALLIVPRVIRRLLIRLAVCMVFVGAEKTGIIALILGRSDLIDVTLAQRGYEAAKVLELLHESSWSTIFGLGPAGTVDLTFSPDASTLAAAGRYLPMVDDVHLLPAYLMLKLGLFGLVWLILLVIAVISVASKVLMRPRIQIWEVAMLLCLLSGMATALPAATNLLANPLVPLFLGILWARTRPNDDGGQHRDSIRQTTANHGCDAADRECVTIGLR